MSSLMCIRLFVVVLICSLLVPGLCGAAYKAMYSYDGHYGVVNTTERDRTEANRYIDERPDYKFDYGVDAEVAFTLPDWSFPFETQTYSQLIAKTNGSILLGSGDENSPEICVWRIDEGINYGSLTFGFNKSSLNSYFSGGVFVQSMSNPTRVVIEWITEQGDHAGYGRENHFSVVLYPSGRFNIIPTILTLMRIWA